MINMQTQQIDFIHQHVVGKKPTCIWNTQDRLSTIPNTIIKILTYQQVENLWLSKLLQSLTNFQGSFACIFQYQKEYFIIYKYNGKYETLQSSTLCNEIRDITIHYYIL